MAAEEANHHWRNTSSRVRFWNVDAVGFAPMSLVLLMKSWTLFGVGVLTLAVFWYLEYNGMNLPNFMRRMRVRLGGFRKPIKRPNW